MNGTDPCAQPWDSLGTIFQIPIGDDWGWSFVYQDKSGAPIQLGTDVVQGQLYVPFTTAPMLLDANSGRAQMINSSNATFALGLEKAVTSTLQADADPPATHLQIQRVDSTGLIRTIGHIPMQIVTGRATPEAMQPIGFVDPLTGDKVLLVGYSNAVPFTPGRSRR